MHYETEQHARELAIFAMGNPTVRSKHLEPAMNRIARDIVAGRYTQQKAENAWSRVAVEAARIYGQQKLNGWSDGMVHFPPGVRAAAAQIMRSVSRGYVRSRAKMIIGPPELHVTAHSFGRDMYGNVTAHYDVDATRQTKRRRQVGFDAMCMDGAYFAIASAGHRPEWYTTDAESATGFRSGRASATFIRKPIVMK